VSLSSPLELGNDDRSLAWLTWSAVVDTTIDAPDKLLPCDNDRCVETATVVDTVMGRLGLDFAEAESRWFL
jgi:hypothetical protein